MADWTPYDRFGWSLFPIVQHGKVPDPAVLPGGKWEQYQTVRAEPPVVQAWRADARLNTGVATGAVSGVVVFDLDGLDAWIAALERGLPDTLTVRTPRGWHYYFQHPGHTVRNKAGPRWCGGQLGWDIRGDGGYVVGPGSYYVPTDAERAKGKLEGAYAVELDVPIAPLPEWLAALLLAPPVPDIPPVPLRLAETTSLYGQRAMHAELQILADVAQGGVNNQVNLTAFALGQLIAGGEIVETEAREALDEVLLARGIADEEKTVGTVERGLAAGMLEPRAAPVPSTPLELFGTRANGDSVPALPDEPVDTFGPARPLSVVAGTLIPDYFKGCTYVARGNVIFIPQGVGLGHSQFDAIYGGPKFALGADGDQPSKSAWDCYINNELVRLPRAHATCFRPEATHGGIIWSEGLPYLNAYTPARVRRVAGDATPFIQHVRRMLPEGRDADLLLHWCASCVRNPGVKFQWWPVIQGAKGNGKTLLLSAMIYAVGSRYSHLVNPEAMQKTGNQFNAWIERKLFLGFEEIRTGDGQHHFIEMMKDTVTNRQIAAEGKGLAQETVDNRANGMMLTNWPDAVPIEDDERRFAIFWCAQQSVDDILRDGMGGSYFPDLYNWLRDGDGYAIVADYLSTMPLTAALDPARDLHRAPETSSTQGARRASLGNVELEILEAVEEGRHGFRGGWISSDALRGIMERQKVGRKRWPDIMARLGYAYHAGLPEHRVTSPLSDGSRPRLYVVKGHADASLSGQTVGEAYEAAQAVGPPASNVVPFAPRAG